MKLEKFKERDNKRIGIILFTIVCILLVSGVILYQTFAIFEVKTHQNVIKGTVEDPGNLYFAFYVDEKIQKDMPQVGSGYILDEDASYCGINGQDDEKIHVSLTEDYTVHVSGMTTSRTKCNLYFVRGAFILGKPVKAVTSNDGLYEVSHEDSSLDEGFKQTEWRYAGTNPNNYIKFNEEQWRIIGLVNVKISSNNIEQRVKIVRNTHLDGFYAWDSNRSNDWTQATLMKMLNEIYYNSTTGECWKIDSSDIYAIKTECNFDGTGKDSGLNDFSKRMIDEDIIWTISGSELINQNTNTAFNWYSLERGIKTQNNQPYEWGNSSTNTFHSIGLMYPSDLGYATNGGSRKKCLLKYCNK